MRWRARSHHRLVDRHAVTFRRDTPCVTSCPLGPRPWMQVQVVVVVGACAILADSFQDFSTTEPRFHPFSRATKTRPCLTQEQSPVPHLCPSPLHVCQLRLDALCSGLSAHDWAGVACDREPRDEPGYTASGRGTATADFCLTRNLSPAQRGKEVLQDNQLARRYKAGGSAEPDGRWTSQATMTPPEGHNPHRQAVLQLRSIWQRKNEANCLRAGSGGPELTRPGVIECGKGVTF
jgi:hypothetical protein